MHKTDFKKELTCYRATVGQFDIIQVPHLQYLMVDGHGDPNTSLDFKQAIAALYPVSYKLKFSSKADLNKDYVVMPLEGLWWAKDMSTFTTARDKSQWNFTLMIMQPDWITTDMFRQAVEKVADKNAPAKLNDLRLETLEEGLCVQTLHLGSFDDEASTLEAMHYQFIPSQQLTMVKKHHEIYLSDFRKVVPAKLRTVLRQPVRSIEK